MDKEETCVRCGGSLHDIARLIKKALHYPDDKPAPSVLQLVQQLCDDHEEKTRLLQRVDQYLSQLSTAEGAGGMHKFYELG